MEHEMGKLKSYPFTGDFLHHNLELRGKTSLSEVKRLVVRYGIHRYERLPGPEHPRLKRISVFVDRRILKDRNPPSLSDLLSPRDNGSVEVRRARDELKIRDALVRLRTTEEAHAQTEERHFHMLPANRKPGQDSGVSRKVYGPDMWVVVVGERDFIAASVLRFDEEAGILANQIIRKRFLNLMLLGLPRPKREGAGYYDHVHISGTLIYTDSIDEFLGLPRDRVLSTEELLESSLALPKHLRQR